MKETRFKQTEIGLIPEDWEVLSVGNDCTVKARIGWQGLTTSEYMQHGKYGLITSTDIINGKINWSSCFFVCKFRYEQDKNIIVKVGDILISKDGTIGKVGIVSEMPFPATLNSGVFVIRSKNQQIQNATALAFISPYFKDFIKRLTAGSTIVHLYQKDIVKFSYPVPKCTEEQKKIASALTSIDNLILSLDKLIEKKRLIKQGAMQELLTGKKRLPGFTGEWVEKRLGEIGFTYTGLSGKNKNDFQRGDASYIPFLNVLNNPIIDIKDFEKVKINIGENQNKVLKGDLLFNTSSETPDEVGICSLLNADIDNLYLNSFCFGFRIISQNINGLYLSYYFRSRCGRNLMVKLAQGATRYNLPKAQFLLSSINLPKTYAEQKAIASVLTSMDKEIESLEGKKAKYEQIKQGMMQQLLTGKIRLI